MRLNLRALPLVRQLQILFFISGFSALVLEVVYVKLLRYWAGNTAAAVAAVLCAYMAGLAVGSLGAGRWLLRWPHLLALYGGLELLVGLYSVGLPGLMERLKPAYLNVTLWLGPDTSLALVAHFLAAAVLLMIPTLAMGASFPVVVRAASQGSEDRADLAEKLYAANLAGAAAGALLSDFLLVRFWGLGNSLLLVAAVNAAIATWAVVLDRHHPVAAPRTESSATVRRRGARGRDLVLVVALAGGFLVLFQEIVWTHMVGRFLDSTVYGFAIALFGVIAGLGLGAALVARNVGKRPAGVQLPWVAMAAGLLVVLLIPFWDQARTLAVRYPLWTVYVALAILGAAAIVLAPQPKTLAGVLAVFPALIGATLIYRWLDPAGAVFWTHHGVDFAVSGLFMFAPAVLMGMVFPLTLAWYLGAASGGAPSVAPVYAVNTLGSMAGVVVANFLVIPLVGLERSGRLVGCAFFALGLLLLAREVKHRYAVTLAMVPVLAWVFFVPPWDYSKGHTLMGHAGELIYAQEDLNGGVTTVLQNIGEKKLYVNGLFQAGNGYVVANDQARCALVPLLYAREFDRAMIIGIGSGQTGGLVGLFPFKSIDVVDFSPRVVEAARRFFEDTNLGLFSNPRVRLHIADGRHFLLTHPEKLSLLTIEVTRLWVAGEGDLYTREFYELCSARLLDSGVLQQWVPLFDLSLRDTVIILRTVRQVFPYVTLYMGAESGMIVASRSPLEVNYARLREMDSNPQLARLLASLQLPRVFSLLGDCIFVPEGLDAFLAPSPERRISTDLWPHLEYSNARFYLVNPSSRALRLHLLFAQEFRTPPIIGAEGATRGAIQEYAFAERSRLVQTFPPR